MLRATAWTLLLLLPPLALATALEDDCGTGSDASYARLTPPVACEGSWVRGDSADHDHYEVALEPGALLYVNLTTSEQTRVAALCLMRDGWNQACATELPTLAATVQAAAFEDVQIAAVLGIGNPPGEHAYALQVEVAPPVYATQVAEGAFGPALAVLTPSFDIPVVPERVQRATVHLDAPMRPGHELVLTWDRDVAEVWLDLYHEDGTRAFVDCERDLRAFTCRADDWTGWQASSPVTRAEVAMPIGLGLEWRLEYAHWLDAA